MNNKGPSDREFLVLHRERVKAAATLEALKAAQVEWIQMLIDHEAAKEAFEKSTLTYVVNATYAVGEVKP